MSRYSPEYLNELQSASESATRDFQSTHQQQREEEARTREERVEVENYMERTCSW